MANIKFRKKYKVFRARYGRFWLLMLTFILIYWALGAVTPLKAQNRIARTGGNIWASASFPVENFQAYTSGFGYRASPVDGSQQFHAGLDIAAPLGSYVRNWWTGQVVELSDHTACGTMIRIRSGGWTHIYCHLMGEVQSGGGQTYLLDREGGVALALGQDIPVGARIGRIGMTGRTTGPHLHWGLMYGGRYVDPAGVINAMYPG